MFGLQLDIESEIIRVFKSYPRIEKVILFGSRAMGTNSPGADIDLAIVGRDLHLDDLIALHMKLDELWLPYKFDIQILSRIQESALVDHIRRVGKEVYSKA